MRGAEGWYSRRGGAVVPVPAAMHGGPVNANGA